MIVQSIAAHHHDQVYPGYRAAVQTDPIFRAALGFTEQDKTTFDDVKRTLRESYGDHFNWHATAGEQTGQSRERVDREVRSTPLSCL